MQAAMKLGEAMYAAQQADGGEAAAKADSEAEEGVVDAEFTEVSDDDDDKKSA